MTYLTSLANKYMTDKGTVAFEKHGYTEEYYKYIPAFGREKLLEIGIWHGDSLMMWREYNPSMEIHAIDIDTKVFDYVKNSNNLHIHIGDQSNHTFLNTVTNESGKFDFIIDNGSHFHIHIVESFKYLWDFVKEGGYYFIEDLHAGNALRDDTIHEIIQFLGKEYKKTIQLVCNGKLLILQK